MKAIIDRARRWLWFIGLWLLGVAAVAVISGILRLWIGSSRG